MRKNVEEHRRVGLFDDVSVATRFAKNMLVSDDGNADANCDLGRCSMLMVDGCSSRPSSGLWLRNPRRRPFYWAYCG